MKKLAQAFQSPSSLDSLSNYSGEMPEDNLLVVLTRTRDSDVLIESNWETALKELGGESDSVEIVRFGHWACGWIEYLCVAEGSEKEEIAQGIEDSLDGYPVLDEEDFCERELNEADEIWKDCYNTCERIQYMRDNKRQFEFHDLSHMMGCVRGKYFSGYASELIG